MFRRPFRRPFPGPWQGEPPEPEHHGPHHEHHEHHGPPRERTMRWERHFGPGRPAFGGRPGWFAPDDEELFDHLIWRGGPRHGGPFGGGPFGGRPFDEDGGGRRRQRRGDIKFALLELLAEQPRHGYELIKELEQRYGGFYRPSPGSVYPTLQLLEDEGHLTSETVAGKRVYTITDTGRQLLAERQPQPGPEGQRHGFRGRGPGPELNDLRQSGMALIASVMQAAQHGSPEQVQSVLKLLDSTRREIYAILSRDAREESSE